jgi:thiosulfate dehydrogenase [quinone] large subunit
MERRAFIQRLPVVSAGLAIASSSTITGCTGVSYLAPIVAPEGLVLPRTRLEEAREVFLQTPDMERPIYVRLLEAGEIVAVLASCTHNGCQPEPLGDRLTCPCHGSEFSFTGAVLTGPAERPLTRYEVLEDGDRLIVVGRGRAS